MSAVGGHHTRITGHWLLGHTTVDMRKPLGRPAFKRPVAEGNSHRPSVDVESQSVSRPQRPQNWQQPPRQGKRHDQKGSATTRPGLTPKNSAPRTPQKALSLERLGDPRHITTFIKQQQHAALSLTTAPHPEAGLASFCSSMSGLLAKSGLAMDFIHFSAIITAAAHIWKAAQRNPRFRGHADVGGRLEGLFQHCFRRLQPLLADMGAREISNVSWSSANLSFDPDDVVPGMVHALTSRFLHFIDVAEKKQRPNAQATANLLWALATMGHPAASVQGVRAICSHFERLTLHPNVQQHPTAQACSNVMWAVAKVGQSSVAATEMVDSVCLHFARLTLSDAQQRPKAQQCANVMWALARLGHSSAAAKEMTDSVCLHFARLVGSPVAQQCPVAQAVANLVWALGTLKHTPPDDRLLDGLCGYMSRLLHSRDQRTHPNAQATANTLWALAQLRHEPSHGVVTAMYDHLVDLCQAPGLQPTSQHISNCFIACAELELDMNPTCVEALLKYFMDMHISSVDYQAYCNVAWNLAVMQCLDLNTFEALLEKLSTMQTMSVQCSNSQSSSVQLNTADVSQLHQALAWLMPSSGSKQMAGWFKVQSRLLTVAPEPAFRKMSIPGQTVMWAALAMQGVPYKAQVQRGVYQADALLSPHYDDGAEVILMVERPGDFIKNVPNRVLGHVAFRNQLLARYGTVVTIPYNSGSSTAENMAEEIKAAVEAKTGLPLDSFRS